MSDAPFSRRTCLHLGLWTGPAILAAAGAACTRHRATRVPEGGPEPARELSRRGADNLVALAELGAMIQWLHPADQVLSSEWQPLMLEGVRGIERAQSRKELVEGLRGLFAEVAPTVTIWRSGELVEDEEELTKPACPDPEAEEDQDEGDDEAEGDEEGSQEGQEGEDAEDAEDAEDPEEGNDREDAEDAEDPEDGEDAEDPEDAENGEDAEDAEELEAKNEQSADDGEDAADDNEPAAKNEQSGEDGEKADEEKADGEKADGEKAEDEKAEDDEKAEGDEKANDDDRPPLSPALLATGDELESVQWHRRGFADGSDATPGCARRITRRPEARPSCESDEADHRRRRRRREAEPPCSRCAGESFRELTPAAVAELALPRGLASQIPIALWSRAGKTLPTSELPVELNEPPSFDERAAWEYSLADRGARLLAVIRTWSLLRHFYGQRDTVPDPRAHLVAAMCRAAEDDSPEALLATLERLLASFGDGNGRVESESGKAARRFVPDFTLRWIEERAVIGIDPVEGLRAADVLTAIDGVEIEILLAQQLPRTAASRSGVAIERALNRLLERRDKGASLELTLLRASEEGEGRQVVRVRADRRPEQVGPGDGRPADPFGALAPGIWYLDATRHAWLDVAARRLRRRADAVIVDLRGELRDARDSFAAHLTREPITVARERLLAGPTREGTLELDESSERTLEPRGPSLSCRVVALADARTCGAAELELVALDRLGARVLGSASAGDLGSFAHAWLPGGWRLRFTQGELRFADGSRLWGRGVSPGISQRPSLAGVREGADELLAAALAELHELQGP